MQDALSYPCLRILLLSCLFLACSLHFPCTLMFLDVPCLFLLILACFLHSLHVPCMFLACRFSMINYNDIIIIVNRMCKHCGVYVCVCYACIVGCMHVFHQAWFHQHHSIYYFLNFCSCLLSSPHLEVRFLLMFIIPCLSSLYF